MVNLSFWKTEDRSQECSLVMRRLWEDKRQVPCHLGHQVDLILSGGGTGEDIHGLWTSGGPFQTYRENNKHKKQQGTGQQTPRKVRTINKSIRNSPERKRREPHLSSVKEYVHRRWRTLIKDISGLSSMLAISRAYQKRRLAHHGGAFSMLPNEECVHTCAGQA